MSFPGADRSIRMEDLQTGRAISRRYRNRRIGEFLKELDLAEGRSTGIPKILRAMRENGSPPPIFESDDDRTWFLVRLPVDARAFGEPTADDTQQVTPQDAPQDTLQDDGHVTDHVEHLVAAVTGEMSRAQLQAVMGLRDRNHFTSAYLRPALDAGMIEMALPRKATSRNQRYRRTASGKVLAQQVKPTGQGTEHDTQQDTPQNAQQDRRHVTDRVEQLVAALTEEMSRAQLQAVMGLRDRSHFTSAYLRPALESGMVVMALPGNATSRNQRYRRTAAGEALSQHNKEGDSSA